MGYYKKLATEQLESARLARVNCSECGGVGYTIVKDDELGDVICACKRCWWVEQDMEKTQNG